MPILEDTEEKGALLCFPILNHQAIDFSILKTLEGNALLWVIEKTLTKVFNVFIRSLLSFAFSTRQPVG